MTETIFKTNAFRIPVKKCCASCAHKDLMRLMGSRWCCKREEKVKSSGWCPKWRMSNRLRMAGFARGKVKRWEYLMFVQSVQKHEDEAECRGEEVVPKSIEELRAEFEALHGSIYEWIEKCEIE